jgi:archaellum component FlaC
MTDQVFEESAEMMIARVKNSEMTLWSETKRQDFVNLFDLRSRAAQYVMCKVARIIADKAKERYFIGQRTYNDLFAEPHPTVQQQYDNNTNDYRVAGRVVSELLQIAEDRAKAILDELPSMNKAVSIIDPETSKMLTEREGLLEKLKVLREELEEIPTELNIRELPAKTTLGEFLKQVDDLEEKRTSVIRKMARIGKEGNELTIIINKRLYKGLPGLSEAVVSVVRQHWERATALSQVTRRVEEKVKFGDNEAAVDLLKGFENDEITISDNVKNEFKAALEKLNLAGSKRLASTKKGK